MKINCTSLKRPWLFQGYTHPREYIVTEWPLSTTCSDIWSLIYDHDCSALVVLCNPTSTVANVRGFDIDATTYRNG